ncbi:MAG: hypothetical protein ABIF77_20420 [bacterium]
MDARELLAIDIRQVMITLVLCLMVGIGLASAVANEPVRIQNPDEPTAGVVIMSLEELWRVGGEDDEQLLLGVVVDAITDAEGNIYLLDTQLSSVQVISPAGEFLRTLSREGEGPGEIRRAAGIQWLPDGSLGLVQAMPGKVVRIDTAGDPLGSMIPGGDDPTAGGRFMLRDLFCRQGRIVAAGSRMTRTDTGGNMQSFVSAFATDGREIQQYFTDEAAFDFRNPVWVEKDRYNVFGGRWALGPDGQIFAARERDRYSVSVYTADGELERFIEREVAAHRRSDREKERVAAGMAPRGRFMRDITVTVEDTAPVISSLRVDDQGRLWVLSSQGNRNQPDGVFCSYDIFDAEGSYIHQLQVAGPGDALQDRLIFLDEDRLIRITGVADAIAVMRGRVANSDPVLDEEEEEAAEETEPLEVICYKIVTKLPQTYLH